MKNNRMNLTPEAKEQEMRFAIRGCQRQPASFFDSCLPVACR